MKPLFHSISRALAGLRHELPSLFAALRATTRWHAWVPVPVRIRNERGMHRPAQRRLLRDD